MLVERKIAFSQNAGNLGRRWTNVPQKTTLKIQLSHEGLSREKGKYYQLITEIGDQTCSQLPLHADLLTPCDLSLDAILFTQFVWEITEGGAREEIWSSVNYLFFIYTSLLNYYWYKSFDFTRGIVNITAIWEKETNSCINYKKLWPKAFYSFSNL